MKFNIWIFGGNDNTGREWEPTGWIVEAPTRWQALQWVRSALPEDDVYVTRNLQLDCIQWIRF